MPYIERSIPKNLLGSLDEKEIYINPTGNFAVEAQTGIVVQLVEKSLLIHMVELHHMGRSIFWKRSTKVDRSAAASRYLAKNVVASKVLINVWWLAMP